MTDISSVAQLEAIYGTPGETSTVKVVDRLTPAYRALMDASPFLCLATAGPEGLDCSPRGDRGELVRVTSDQELLLPDRRGNNRIDSLRNIVRDPRLAVLFLLPGSGTTLRINGVGTITADPKLLDSFSVDGKLPRSVVRIEIQEVYFQCARAIVRSGIWDRNNHVDHDKLPTPGQILADLSGGNVDGDHYDAEWPERAQKTLW